MNNYWLGLNNYELCIFTQNYFLNTLDVFSSFLWLFQSDTLFWEMFKSVASNVHYSSLRGITLIEAPLVDSVNVKNINVTS